MTPSIPVCRLEHLGDASFKSAHGVRYALMSGAMANGIGSVEIVQSMGKNGFLGVFGSAGLSLSAVAERPRSNSVLVGRFDALWNEPDP